MPATCELLILTIMEKSRYPPSRTTWRRQNEQPYKEEGNVALLCDRIAVLANFCVHVYPKFAPFHLKKIITGINPRKRFWTGWRASRRPSSLCDRNFLPTKIACGWLPLSMITHYMKNSGILLEGWRWRHPDRCWSFCVRGVQCIISPQQHRAEGWRYEGTSRVEWSWGGGCTIFVSFFPIIEMCVVRGKVWKGNTGLGDCYSSSRWVWGAL